MKYIKYFALVLSLLLIGNLIYVATENDNFVVAGVLAMVFLIITYLGVDMRARKYKIDLENKTISVNED